MQQGRGWGREEAKKEAQGKKDQKQQKTKKCQLWLTTLSLSPSLVACSTLPPAYTFKLPHDHPRFCVCLCHVSNNLLSAAALLLVTVNLHLLIFCVILFHARSLPCASSRGAG